MSKVPPGCAYALPQFLRFTKDFIDVGYANRFLLFLLAQNTLRNVQYNT